MRALIFLRLTRITNCFAAFAGRNGVTPSIQRASNTKISFSSRSSRIHQKRSQKVRNPKFSWGGGGAMPPDPLADAYARFSRTGTPLFKILDPPLEPLDTAPTYKPVCKLYKGRISTKTGGCLRAEFKRLHIQALQLNSRSPLN